MPWSTSPTFENIADCLANVKALSISLIPLWTALAVPCITSTEDLPVPFATSATLFKYPFKAFPVKFLSYTFRKSVIAASVSTTVSFQPLAIVLIPSDIKSPAISANVNDAKLPKKSSLVPSILPNNPLPFVSEDIFLTVDCISFNSLLTPLNAFSKEPSILSAEFSSSLIELANFSTSPPASLIEPLILSNELARFSTFSKFLISLDNLFKSDNISPILKSN